MARRGLVRMVPLGYGKHVRADRIVLLEPIATDDGRGGGARTRVWIEGVAEPVVASRTERSILADMNEPRRHDRRSEAPEASQPGLF